MQWVWRNEIRNLQGIWWIQTEVCPNKIAFVYFFFSVCYMCCDNSFLPNAVEVIYKVSVLIVIKQLRKQAYPGKP